MSIQRITRDSDKDTLFFELNLAGSESWEERIADPSEVFLKEIASAFDTNPKSIVIGARVSDGPVSADPLALAAREMVRGVAGSAALEFADIGCRVNTVLSTSETGDSQIRAVKDYFSSDEDAGFTTGATIDLTGPGIAPPKPSETLALVTGGAGGLGRAAAERLHAEGYQVVISDLPGEQLDKAAQEIGIEAIGANLSEPADLEKVRTHPSLDGLNALFLHHGVGASSRLDSNYDAAAGHRSVVVNGTSVWSTFNHLRPVLERTGNATVVMLSSVAGLQAEPGNGAYGAAKFAVVGFVKGNFERLASAGIRLHALCPGPIDTPLMRSVFAGFARDLGVTPEEFTAERLGGIPLKRAGEPRHIGAAAYLLARVASPGVVLAPTGGEVLT